jgi:hydroxymethylpyrimidine/phosphomethylpyrimidine kinase
MTHHIPLGLTIAGSETTGGAGIQADIKTFEEYGVHGMVVLTLIVTINPNNWAHEVYHAASRTMGEFPALLINILAGVVRRHN